MIFLPVLNCLKGNTSPSHQTYSSPSHVHTSPRVTLKFVNSGDNPKNLHLKLDFWLGLFLGVQLLLLLGPPPHPEQHGGGGEAVGTHGVAVGVLGAEIQLQPFGRVGVDLSARAGRAPVSIPPTQPRTPGPASSPTRCHGYRLFPSHSLRGITPAPPAPAAHHRGVQPLPSWVLGRNK